MFIRDWDSQRFDSEEEAFDDAGREMLDYSEEYLKPWVSYDDLVAWAMKQEGFFEAFENELANAQQSFFEDFYVELEDDENADSKCESESNL